MKAIAKLQIGSTTSTKTIATKRINRSNSNTVTIYLPAGFSSSSRACSYFSSLASAPHSWDNRPWDWDCDTSDCDCESYEKLRLFSSRIETFFLMVLVAKQLSEQTSWISQNFPLYGFLMTILLPPTLSSTCHFLVDMIHFFKSVACLAVMEKFSLGRITMTSLWSLLLVTMFSTRSRIASNPFSDNGFVLPPGSWWTSPSNSAHWTAGTQDMVVVQLSKDNVLWVCGGGFDVGLNGVLLVRMVKAEFLLLKTAARQCMLGRLEALSTLSEFVLEQ